MAITFAKAPAKVILFGEHAVVYGKPAIAIPVMRVNATARILPSITAEPGLIQIHAPDIHLNQNLADLPKEHPLAAAVHMSLASIAPAQVPALTIQITSTIPVASGMGSSAATSIAIIQALVNFFGAHLSPSKVSDLAFEIEKIYHGTPSGIDNNVIAHQQPIYFTKEKPIEFLQIEVPTHWVIANTGEMTPTRIAVEGMRERYTADPDHYEPILCKIGEITQQARDPLKIGDLEVLGRLLSENQQLLKALGVSSDSLETLVDAAIAAGAKGAKLSGGGMGGNIIALVPVEKADSIAKALKNAGAKHTIITRLSKSELL